MRRLSVGSFAVALLFAPCPVIAQEVPRAGKSETTQLLLSVKPGMTRAQLRKILVTEGGLSTRLRRAYVNPKCDSCKVMVEFRAVGPGEPFESDKDIIVQVSAPFQQHPIYD